MHVFDVLEKNAAAAAMSFLKKSAAPSSPARQRRLGYLCNDAVRKEIYRNENDLDHEKEITGRR